MGAAAVLAVVASVVLWGPSLYNSLTTNRVSKSSTSGLTAAKSSVQFAADSLPSSPGGAPCTRLNVLASLDNADAVRAVADAYDGKARNAGGKCVDVSVAETKSGLAAEDAARGFAGTPIDQRPAVWVPDSPAWLATARAAGGQAPNLIPDHGTTLASTAVGLAMPEPMAQALGWDAKPPSWDTVFKTAADPLVWERAGKPEWGYFRLVKANATMATSGLLALASEYSAAAATGADLATADLRSQFATARVQLNELATASYMSTPSHALQDIRDAADVTAASASLSAIITDERSVWAYNRGITGPDGQTGPSGVLPKVPLRMVYPSDGVYTADSTAVAVSGSWVGDAQKAAADDFTKFMGTEKAQTAVRAAGFRDLRGEADTAVAEAGKFGTAPRVLPALSSDLATALQSAFPAVRKPARVLVDVDLSGSMGDEISPGVTKLQSVEDAVAASLGGFGFDDQVGLAGFTNTLYGRLEPGTVAPVAPIKGTKETLVAMLRGLVPVAQTPLYEAVGQAVDTLGEAYRSDAINAVVVVSGGPNDTTRPGTLEELQAKLQSQPAGKRVKVFAIAYGSQADTDALKAIASASGGAYFDATDPKTLNAVLRDAMGNF